MGKASRTKTDIHRRERIAAQRAAQRRREQRQRLLIALGSIIAVVAVVVVFVVVKTSSSGNSNNAGGASNGPTGTALTAVVNDVTGVPASALDKVGAGGSKLSGSIQKLTGQTALTSSGKPEIYFEGAEYCPYCAANRWGLIVALSRFGTFSGLKTIHSSSTDSPANVPTWTFHGSTYTSKYISFVAEETTTNVLDTATQEYPTLDTPTAAETALFTQLDAPPYVSSSNKGAIPFVDFGNQYLQVGDLPMLQPTSISGSWATIAGDLSKPSTANAKAIDGAANFMTATICKLTGNQPATACTSTIQGLESQV